MTRVTPHGGLVLLVAVDAPLHLQGLLETHGLLRRDIAMAPCASDLRRGMRAVAEEDKIRQLMKDLEWYLPLSQIDVTTLTLRKRWKARAIGRLAFPMARRTLQLQRRMLLVIERPVLTCSPQTQGKEKASKESEYLSLYLLPPPAAITTYCFFVFFE